MLLFGFVFWFMITLVLLLDEIGDFELFDIYDLYCIRCCLYGFVVLLVFGGC